MVICLNSEPLQLLKKNNIITIYRLDLKKEKSKEAGGIVLFTQSLLATFGLMST